MFGYIRMFPISTVHGSVHVGVDQAFPGLLRALRASCDSQSFSESALSHYARPVTADNGTDS